MILSDKDILDEIESGELVVDPLDDPDIQIQPASIDLRLGEHIMGDVGPGRFSICGNHTGDIKYSKSALETVHGPDGRVIVEPNLYPGDFILGETLEHVEIPPHFAAKVDGRSSMGRLGLMVHVTAGYIDPGFKGKITLELHNVGSRPIKLVAGERVCQLVLHEMRTPAARPYGERQESKYQNQDGVTPSRQEKVHVDSSD